MVAPVRLFIDEVMMMPPCAFPLLGGHATAPGTDCGAVLYRVLLRRTEALVVSRSPIDEVVGEMPTRQGTQECARVEFSIDPSGHPADVIIVESSGNMAFGLAATRAVQKYKFRSEFLSGYRTYSIIISGVADKQPPGYLKGVDVKKGHERAAI